MLSRRVSVRSVALGLALGCLVLSAGGGSALGSGANLIPNPTFDPSGSYSFSGWGLTNATTLSASPGEDDNFATLVQPTGTLTYGVFVKPQPVSLATVGSQYQGSAWLRSDAPGKSVCVNLRDVTSGGTLAQLIKNCTTTTNTWVQVTTPVMTVLNTGDTVGFTVTQSSSVVSTDSFQVDNTSLVQLSGSTDTTPPSQPTSLTATQVTSSSVSLSWAASTDPDDSNSLLTYQVSRNGTVVGTTSPGATSFSDTGLSAGTQYSYTVTAFDPAGNGSPPSDPLQVTTSQDTTAPTAPTGVTATPNGNSITVAWKASTDSDNPSSSLTYDVYQYTNLLATVAGTSPLSVTDSSLQSGTSASYYVVARDPSGNQSASSTTVWATTASAATTVADWEMDEPSGSTTMLDSSGNAINGPLTNVKAGQPGVNGTGYSFTPKAYVTVLDNPMLDPGNRDISITLHFKTSNLPSSGDYDLLRKGKSPSGNEYKVELLGSGQVLCSFHGSNGVGVQSTGSSLANGAWHTITCARTDWRTASLTVDGSQFTHTNGPIGAISPTQNFYLGANPDAGNDYYKGSLDDVTIQVG